MQVDLVVAMIDVYASVVANDHEWTLDVRCADHVKTTMNDVGESESGSGDGTPRFHVDSLT